MQSFRCPNHCRRLRMSHNRHRRPPTMIRPSTIQYYGTCRRPCSCRFRHLSPVGGGGFRPSGSPSRRPSLRSRPPTPRPFVSASRSARSNARSYSAAGRTAEGAFRSSPPTPPPSSSRLPPSLPPPSARSTTFQRRTTGPAVAVPTPPSRRSPPPTPRPPVSISHSSRLHAFCPSPPIPPSPPSSRLPPLPPPAPPFAATPREEEGRRPPRQATATDSTTAGPSPS